MAALEFEHLAAELQGVSPSDGGGDLLGIFGSGAHPTLIEGVEEEIQPAMEVLGRELVLDVNAVMSLHRRSVEPGDVEKHSRPERCQLRKML